MSQFWGLKQAIMFYWGCTLYIFPFATIHSVIFSKYHKPSYQNHTTALSALRRSFTDNDTGEGNLVSKKK